MKNILSRNQLEEWHHTDTSNYSTQKENDYYECMIECEDSQTHCKTTCREILM